MNKRFSPLILAVLLLGAAVTHAGPAEQAQMVVWINEAIVATYSYSYKNYLQEQKQIAKYFTAQGWMSYTKALNDSKLPETVQKNMYYVSAVPTEPPVITAIDATHWKATMGLLVAYKNPQYQQLQTLRVTIGFNTAPPGQGVRGYSINSLQAVMAKPACQCPIEEEDDTAAAPANAENAK